MNIKYLKFILLLFFTFTIYQNSYSQFSIDFSYIQGFNIDVSEFPLLKMKFIAYDNDKPIILNQNQITINKDNVFYKILNLTNPDLEGYQTLSWYSRNYKFGQTNIFFQHNNKVLQIVGTYNAFATFTNILSDKNYSYYPEYQFGDVKVGEKKSEFLYVKAIVTKFENENMIDVDLDSLVFSNPDEFSYYWYGFNNSNPPPAKITSPFRYLFDVIYTPKNTNYKRSKLTAHYDGGMESSVNLTAGWFNIDRSTVLNLIYPNGGEKFAPCDIVKIKWKGNSDLLPTIVEYSTDGKIWKHITSTRDSFCLWQVPNEITANARIRIRQELQNTSSHVLRVDNVPVFAVDYSFNGQKLLTANTEGVMQEWDLNTYSPLDQYIINPDMQGFIRDSIRGLKYFDEDKFAVAYFVRNPMYRQDSIAFFQKGNPNANLIIAIDTIFKTKDMFLSPDKKYLTLIPEVGNEIWNISVLDGSIASKKLLPYPISTFNYTKETNSAIVAYKNNLVQVLSYPDFNILGEYDFQDVPLIHKIALSPNNKLIAVSCFPPTPSAVTETKTESHIFDIDTKQIVRTKRISASTPIGLEFNPSSSFCVSANENQPQIVFWDLPTNDIPGTLTGNVGELTDMAYAPDGGSIAASAKNSSENVTIRHFTYPESDSSDNVFAIIKPDIKIDTIFVQPNYFYIKQVLSYEKKICNNGPVDLILTSHRFIKNKHFKLININFPDTVKVGFCQTIRFEYMPIDTGWVADTLVFSSCFGDYLIPIKAYIMKRNIDFLLSSFDFGESCLTDSVEKDVDLLKNNDPIDAIINYIGISKGIDSPFRILTPINDTIIKPGQILKVKIKFNPKTIGQNLDKVMAFYSGQQYLFPISNLTGLGIGTQVKLSHNDLRFIPEIPNRKLKINNLSNNPITISKTDFIPSGLFTCLTPLPISIKPGDSTEIEILWNGSSFTNVKLKIEATPCVTQSEINIGQYSGNSFISVPIISADPNDENVEIPISFENSNNYDYNGTRFFESEISINPRIFLPLSVTSTYGIAKLTSNEIINDKRVFKIRVDGDFSKTGNLAIIKGVAGLAEIDSSIIEIKKNSVFWGTSVKTTTKDGLFRLINLCGDRRIIQNSGGLEIMSISPVPANEFLNLELNSETAEEYNIEITDVLGTKLFGQKYKLNIGLNSISIPLSNFTSGYYYLKIENSHTVINRQILILR